MSLGLRTRLSRFRHRLRLHRIGRRLGTVIPNDVYIAPTAQFQLCPDGWPLGGTIRIGRGVRICHGAILAPFGGSIELEDDVCIGPYCVIYGHGGLRIGRGTLIAAHCVLIPASHRFDDADKLVREQGEISRGASIGKDVWLGAGVKVLDGVTIGDRSVIGAGAVVNRSIEANSIAVGVPARIIGRRGLREPAILEAIGAQ
jgi:acetyltransferase-like isoleucine patch superfamily enzyme